MSSSTHTSRHEAGAAVLQTSDADLAVLDYSDHGPLALNSWSTGAHGFSNVLPTIERRIHSIGCESKRKLAFAALMSRTADHANRSFDNFRASGIDQQTLAPSQVDVVNGDVSTHQFVQFLGQYPTLRSIEIARLIHPGDWNVRQYIDEPVRCELADPAYELDTVALKGTLAQPHYKFKQFDFDGNSHPDSAIVERKRRVSLHLGGQVMTIVRNTVLVDGNHISDDLRDHIRAAKHNAKDDRSGYDTHSADLYDLLEDHMRSLDTSRKPREIIPLMSTYYTARIAYPANL